MGGVEQFEDWLDYRIALAASALISSGFVGDKDTWERYCVAAEILHEWKHSDDEDFE